MILRLSANAKEDLISIWEYSCEHWGLEQADLYIDLLLLRIAWLAEHQGLWHPRPELGEDVFSYPEQLHSIYISTINKKFTVLRVLHSRVEPSQVSA